MLASFALALGVVPALVVFPLFIGGQEEQENHIKLVKQEQVVGPF